MVLNEIIEQSNGNSREHGEHKKLEDDPKRDVHGALNILIAVQNIVRGVQLVAEHVEGHDKNNNDLENIEKERHPRLLGKHVFRIRHDVKFLWPLRQFLSRNDESELCQVGYQNADKRSPHRNGANEQ